jgi:hypothetical protein
VETKDMQAYRVETTLEHDGKLALADLPFRAGESVEIIILAKPTVPPPGTRYPLRGTPITYIRPTEPVAAEDWEAGR